MTRPAHTRALVTGASSGIGRALSLRLAARGIEVVVAARRRELLDELVAEIASAGGRAEALVLDVADAERTEAVVREQSARRFLDLVVANAGLGTLTRADRPRWANVHAVLNVNLVGAVATLWGALPAMLEAGRGHLVGISSLMGYGRALPGFAAYSASKVGLATFLEGMRLDLWGRGIVVSTVMPGFVKTPMTSTARFKMPFAVELDAAGEIIDAAIRRGDPHCAFPLPLAAAARMLPMLPDSLYERVAHAKRRP